MRKANIFVLGHDPRNLAIMRSLTHADQYQFHGLISYDEIFEQGKGEDVAELLREAEQALRSFEGPIDGIVGFYDFPVTDLLPILRAPYDLPSVSLSSVLKCEHKYWSRLEQRESIPECVPRFQRFDPFEEDPLAHLDMQMPFWVKPVKSFASYLGFMIRTKEDFERALPIIRRNIGMLAEPFNEIVEMADDVPEHIRSGASGSCIAESIIGGRQCTLEGYVHQGEVVVYGIVDSVSVEGGSSFERYQYPSALPNQVTQRMREAATRFMEHIEYDDSPFNMEFYWDEKSDQLWCLEVNPRISQSHADLFRKVDGESHHKVMIDLELGKRPDFPHRQGKYPLAAKMFYRRTQDGLVTKVPNQNDLDRLHEDYPDAEVVLVAKEGKRLSELPHQDSYSYELARIYIGGADEDGIYRKYRAITNKLPFRFER